MEREPIRLAFHLAAEFATAALLIMGGTGLLLGKSWARFLSAVALGMLLYTVMVSPGYFAQSGQRARAAMFAGLLLPVAISPVLLWRSGRDYSAAGPGLAQPEVCHGMGDQSGILGSEVAIYRG